MPVTIEAWLTNNEGRLKGLPKDVSNLISEACSFEVKGADKSQLFKKGRWDGRKKLYNKQTGKFQMGLWDRIRQILSDNRIIWVTYDQRTDIRGHIDASLSDQVESRPYQDDAMDHAISAKRSVLQVATGGGKTVIASKLISFLKCRTLFLVHTKDLLYQAKESFETMLIGEDVAKIGQVGDGVIDVQPITVATMQTMSKFLGVKYENYQFDDVQDDEANTDVSGSHGVALRRLVELTDLVIWDEVHRVACDMASGVSDAITNAPYRVGLSASPWRDDGADIMIEAAMGAVSYQISASQLIDMGYLVPPIIKRVSVPSSIPWYLDTRSYDTIYKEEIVENAHRNDLIVKYASDFMTLGITTMVLVVQIKHGKTLKKAITEQFHPTDFLSGRDFSHVRNQTIQEMRDGDRIGLVASTIADEGLDIKRLAGLILAGGGKSSTRALQRIGRVLRPFEGKTHALIIDFDDQALYLRDHTARRREIFATEPRFTILELGEE